MEKIEEDGGGRRDGYRARRSLRALVILYSRRFVHCGIVGREVESIQSTSLRTGGTWSWLPLGATRLGQ